MNAPAKKFYYWRNQKGGPREGSLILKDKVVPFNLDDGESYIAASRILGEAVGIVLKVPADGLYQMSGIGWDDYKHKYDTVEKAVAAFWAETRRLELEQKFLDENPDARLELALSRRDWYSAMSDDHSVWARGEKQAAEISKLIKLVDKMTVKRLWGKYAPAEFPCPV